MKTELFQSTARRLQIDRAVGFALASRVWQAITGQITALLIVFRLTAVEQGYYYAFMWLLGLPYGVYDIVQNHAFVTIGISKDTAEFAVEAIRRWWNEPGTKLYKHPKRILITGDSGGSNGYRNRLWKFEL